MILLITPLQGAQECVRAFHEATGENTQIAASLRQAVTHLRSQEYAAVVIDQSLLEAEPVDGDLALQHIGTAVPVHVNFAISGMDRVVREVRAALCRRKREVLVARQAAEETLRSELKGTVTALLLSCEMALSVPDLSSAATSKIRAIHELARQMRSKIGMPG